MPIGYSESKNILGSASNTFNDFFSGVLDASTELGKVYAEAAINAKYPGTVNETVDKNTAMQAPGVNDPLPPNVVGQSIPKTITVFGTAMSTDILILTGAAILTLYVFRKK